MKYLSPSLLSANFAELGKQVAILDKAGAQYVHIDIMDGMFVPSISMGLPVIKSIRSKSSRIFDVHLMIEEPDRYIDDFIDAGANVITVHAEACKHLDRTIQKIKKRNIFAGIALNPETSLRVLDYMLGEVDLVLVMTVNPGFGGQKLIPYTIDKIRHLKELAVSRNLKVNIEADGGITLGNAEKIMEAGADIIVAGSAVFEGNIEENIHDFLRLMEVENDN